MGPNGEAHERATQRVPFGCSCCGRGALTGPDQHRGTRPLARAGGLRLVAMAMSVIASSSWEAPSVRTRLIQENIPRGALRHGVDSADPVRGGCALLLVALATFRLVLRRCPVAAGHAGPGERLADPERREHRGGRVPRSDELAGEFAFWDQRVVGFSVTVSLPCCSRLLALVAGMVAGRVTGGV